eukprot:2582858-Amphidinium_carterae.1
MTSAGELSSANRPERRWRASASSSTLRRSCGQGCAHCGRNAGDAQRHRGGGGLATNPSVRLNDS